MNAQVTSRISDVMNTEVLTFRDDKSVSELATFLSSKEISGVPVVNRVGRLVGVVSVTDIAERIDEDNGKSPNHLGPMARLNGHLTQKNLKVRDIMTPTIFTVPDDTPVQEVARTMIVGRVHRLFVTREGHVVGIVTPLDLLKLLVAEPPRKRRAAR